MNKKVLLDVEGDLLYKTDNPEWPFVVEIQDPAMYAVSYTSRYKTKWEAIHDFTRHLMDIKGFYAPEDMEPELRLVYMMLSEDYACYDADLADKVYRILEFVLTEIIETTENKR